MKNKSIFFFKIQLAVLLTVFFLQVNAQTLPGFYTTSWAGNSFVPTTQDYNLVQGWASSMSVEGDGTIYTNCHWDEAAKELGIYKNGLCTGIIPNQHGHADGGGITTNDTYIWATVHNGKISRFNKSDYAEDGTEFLVSTITLRGLAASATELFASDFANNLIKVYSTTSHGTFLRSWAVTKPGPLSIDAAGNLWVLTSDVNPWGPGTGSCIKRFSPNGALLNTITLPAGVEARSLCVDKLRNEILITDIGDNMQVYIYNNISSTPTLVQSLGTQGGILSGTKGLVAPLKFNVPNLAGVDAAGNIIVWSNGNNPSTDKVNKVDGDGMGSCVESYTRAGVRNWQMLGLEFVDMGTFDPSTDGVDLYTKHEHFTMDYTKPDGQQWTWKGWTLDRKNYANSDVRTKNDGGHLSSTLMRRINGNLLMYLNSMSGDGFSFYRYTTNNEIAIPCGEILGKSQWTDLNADGQKNAGETATNVLWQYNMFGNYVDNKGDIWFVYDDIRKHTLQSITNGVPNYNLTPVITAIPAPFNSLRRIQYDSDNDVMYLSGYTPVQPYSNDWKSCGLVMARYNNWSTGNRTAAYSINLPSSANGDFANMVSLTIEKDYIFVVGIQTRSKVWVYNALTGTLAGTMTAGSNVGGVSKTGWCDVVNSIAAFRKSNGEYLISVEEDGWEKILIYRWIPGPVVTYPIITARGENPPNEGKDKAFDVNNTTKWLDFNATSWIQIQYATAAVYSQYTIVSGNDLPDRDPKNWTLEGSNNGISWAVLSNQTNQTWSARNQTKVFSFSNSNAYAYYKLNITANNGGTITQLSEITFGNTTPQTGTAYRWFTNATELGVANETADTKLNNGVNTDTVWLKGGTTNPSESIANQYESAGLKFGTARNITSFEFINGPYAGGTADGSFNANLKIQTSTDGITWTNATGWTVSPNYAYGQSSIGNATFTFTGSASNIKGIRVSGQLRTCGTTSCSWEAAMKELKAYGTTYSAARLANPATVAAVASLAPVANDAVAILPNPANTNFQIRNLTLMSGITIIATDGKLMHHSIADSKNITINTANWAKGMYKVIITNKKSVITKSIIVN